MAILKSQNWPKIDKIAITFSRREKVADFMAGYCYSGDEGQDEAIKSGTFSRRSGSKSQNQLFPL